MSEQAIINNEQKSEAVRQDSLLGRFSGLPFSPSFPTALTLVESRPGMIVVNNEGIFGIIFAVKPKSRTPVYVMQKGRVSVAGSPQNYKRSSASFEEARSKRSMSDKEVGVWEEGDTGYLMIKGKIEPIIIGPKSGSKRTIYVVDSTGRYTNLDEAFILKNVTDEPPL